MVLIIENYRFGALCQFMALGRHLKNLNIAVRSVKKKQEAAHRSEQLRGGEVVGGRVVSLRVFFCPWAQAVTVLDDLLDQG